MKWSKCNAFASSDAPCIGDVAGGGEPVEREGCWAVGGGGGGRGLRGTRCCGESGGGGGGAGSCDASIGGGGGGARCCVCDDEAPEREIFSNSV